MSKADRPTCHGCKQRVEKAYQCAWFRISRGKCNPCTKHYCQECIGTEAFTNLK